MSPTLKWLLAPNMGVSRLMKLQTQNEGYIRVLDSYTSRMDCVLDVISLRWIIRLGTWPVLIYNGKFTKPWENDTWYGKKTIEYIYFSRVENTHSRVDLCKAVKVQLFFLISRL